MTKTQIYSKLTYLVLAVIILFTYCTTSYSADDIDDRVIKSFKVNSDITNEIDQYKRRGYYEGDIYIVDIGGGCGVAGCSRTVLVIQNLTSSGSNPQTTSVMAEINLSPVGAVENIKLVMLTPFGQIRSVPRVLDQGITEVKPIAPMPRILNQGMTGPKPISPER